MLSSYLLNKDSSKTASVSRKDILSKMIFTSVTVNNVKIKSSTIENNTLTSSLTFCRRNYFQEGGRVNMMNVKEAFRRSLQTWKSWALHNLDSRSSVFFRSFSPVHFRQVHSHIFFWV